MKKLGLLLAVMVAFVATGCTTAKEEEVEKGMYNEGTYFASVTSTDYKDETKTNTTTGVMYVDENGMIKSVTIDVPYMKDGSATSKRVLGDDYGMVAYSEATKEWYEQAEMLEKKLIETQKMDFFTLNEKGKTDTVSGVTISVGDIHKVLEKLVSDAK